MDEYEDEIKIKGEEVTEFPKLLEMQPIQLKVLGIRADKDKTEITKAEILT